MPIERDAAAIRVRPEAAWAARGPHGNGRTRRTGHVLRQGSCRSGRSTARWSCHGRLDRRPPSRIHHTPVTAPLGQGRVPATRTRVRRASRRGNHTCTRPPFPRIEDASSSRCCRMRAARAQAVQIGTYESVSIRLRTRSRLVEVGVPFHCAAANLLGEISLLRRECCQHPVGARTAVVRCGSVAIAIRKMSDPAAVRLFQLPVEALWQHLIRGTQEQEVIRCHPAHSDGYPSPLEAGE